MQTLILAVLAAATAACGEMKAAAREGGGSAVAPVRLGSDRGPVLEKTPEYAVTPTGGVWDVEYGRTEDPDDISFRFALARYANGIGVTARVVDDRIVTDDCKPATLTCPSWDDDNLECFFDGDNDKSQDARAGDGLSHGGEFTSVANGAAQSDFSGWPNSFGQMWFGTVTTNALASGSSELVYDMFFTWGCLGRKTAPSRTKRSSSASTSACMTMTTASA